MSRRSVRRQMATTLLGAIGLVRLAQPAAAQDRCALRIDAPERNAVGESGGGRSYTTYLGGGTVTLRCGNAVMTGDSAVHYASEDRAEMVGQVSYRDATRTLSAQRLTYYEANGQVVAAGDVELVRLSSGARLAGPRVSFFRAGSAGGRTLATQRPHMTFPPEPGGRVIEVDADETEFIGDTISIGRGNVVLHRSDFDATADSAVLLPALGRLYGRPRVTARGMRLEGDSLHAGIAAGDLDRLHAFGAARAEGETVELEAEQILVTWGEDEVERIEAFGTGRSLAASDDFLIAGDSLDVAFTGGQPDSVTAVGTARTFQLGQVRDTTAELVEPTPELSDDVGWIAGDSIRGWLETEDDTTRVHRLRSTGGARSFFAAVRDSAQGRLPSRNYIIGETIDIAFSAGDPVSVTADQAIGVYLEPSDRPPPNSTSAQTESAGGRP